MRRAMEYVRWELDNWRTQRHGRDRSIFTETQKVASYMWQSWKRGALVVLVLVFLPILFPLVLFLSFVGFISAVPLLCGAAAHYLLFRSFSLPLSITELFNPVNPQLEGLITGSQCGEGRMLESLPFVIQEAESGQDESSLKTSAIGEDGTEDPGRVSDAKTILLLECELVANERDEADNREHHSTFELNVSSEVNQRNSESGAGSSSSVRRHSNAVLQVRGPIFLLPSAKLKSQYEQRKDERTWSLNGIGEVADVSSNELSKSGCQKAPTRGMMVSEKEPDVVDSNRTCAYSSSTVTFEETNYPVQGLGLADFPRGKSFPAGEQQMYSGISEAIEDEPAANVIRLSSENSKSSTKISMMDVPFSGLLEEGYIFESVCGTSCIPETRHITEMDRICDIGACHGSSMVEGYGEYPTAKSVFVEHNVTVAPTDKSPETSGRFRGHAPDEKDPSSAGNGTLTGNSELNIKASVNSTSIPFSYSALLTTPDVIARADSESVTQTVPARYWRDEVEVTVLSSAFANITCMENRNSGASGDMASLMSFKSESEKMMMSDQDGVSVLECDGEAEVFSALQTPNSGQYRRKMVEGENGSGSSLRFATSLFTHQRRLSFNNVLADDEMESPVFFVPSEKFNDFTPDCKKRSVSTSFSSDYTWPSEFSEQGLDFLSTTGRGIAYEELCLDTASSTAQYEEESDLEPGVVSDSAFSPTPDQLTEDWETRRKRWAEESTLGRLAPLSPYIEAHSVEARSMCNPLFEFSTPSPPLKKLNTGDKNHISNSPSLHTCISKRHSASPEILRAQTCSSGSSFSPRQLRVQKCKSGLYAERLESSTRRHARSYSASFTESMEPSSGEFEGLLGYWWRRDKTAHSLTSSPRHYPTAASPAEVAHRIREEIDAIQMVIGQVIPSQYSLWKEVENLSQIIGMKLPYMGDMSDMSKARQGLDLLKIVVCSRWDVEL